MEKVNVTLDSQGFINCWTYSAGSGFIEILSEPDLVGLLDCVEVIDGTAVINVKKQQELINEKSPLSEIEQLKEENQEMNLRQDMLEEVILELGDMVLADTLGGGN